MEYDADFFINKMMKYYDVHTIIELSKILGIGQPAISKWKINNSINTIKKKCRELDIYDEIFGDSSSVSIVQGSGGRAAGRNYKEGEKTSESQQSQLDELTMSLVKKLVEKIGEDELQFKLMELIKNG